MANVVIISGATSSNSRLNGIEEEVISYLTQAGIEYEQIRVQELPAQDLINANFKSSEIQKANQVIEKSDGVVILTPVYKAAYSGVLKTYLDLIPQNGFQNKPILPLVIGGSYEHFLAKDFALKPVLAALGATTTLNGVYVVDSQVERVGENQFEVHSEVQERLRGEISILVDLLEN